MDERDQTFLRGFEAAKAGRPCPDNAYADHAAGHVAFREMTQGVESYLTRRAVALGAGVTQEDVEVAESRATAKPEGQDSVPEADEEGVELGTCEVCGARNFVPCRCR